MIQRGGQVAIQMLENVQQVTIKPLIQSTIAPGTLIYTDEYAIYDRLEQWGYSRKSVCHGAGEYARDEDGDGFYEVHVEHHGRFLVAAAFLVTSASRNFSSLFAHLSRFF